MSWPISDVFPSSGSITKTLDVGPSYFFLKIDNTSGHSVTGVYVNYGLVPQTYDAITFGSGTFNIGYYAAYTNTDIRCISGACRLLADQRQSKYDPEPNLSFSR